jgi:cysteine desulfurase
MSLNLPIYLDYNATTPVDKTVLDTMLPYFTEKFGNASSKTHAFGWVAADAVEMAREQVAKLIDAETAEIVFTSGATESINTAIKGVAEAYKSKGNHIITIATEHKAMLDTCAYLETKGYDVTYLPVDRSGLIDIAALKQSITDKTILVSVMYGKNETGVIQPIKEIAEIVHTKNSLLFCDATQAVGKVAIDVKQEGIDILCMSAHKIYGPKGIGALYVSRKKPRVTILPLLHGSGHENGKRAGTLNVPLIVGLGAACELAETEMWNYAMHTSMLRTRLEQGLTLIEGVYINGSIKHRLPNVTNIAFDDINTSLIAALPNIAVSSGSACSSVNAEPSHVLKTMQLSDKLTKSSIRFSLGRFSTVEEVDYTIKYVGEVVAKLRA